MARSQGATWQAWYGDTETKVSGMGFEQPGDGTGGHLHAQVHQPRGARALVRGVVLGERTRRRLVRPHRLRAQVDEHDRTAPAKPTVQRSRDRPHLLIVALTLVSDLQLCPLAGRLSLSRLQRAGRRFKSVSAHQKNCLLRGYKSES